MKQELNVPHGTGLVPLLWDWCYAGVRDSNDIIIMQQFLQMFSNCHCYLIVTNNLKVTKDFIYCFGFDLRISGTEAKNLAMLTFNWEH